MHSYLRNLSVTPEILAAMKAENGMTPGIRALHSAMVNALGTPLLAPLDVSPVTHSVFYNDFNLPFVDPNNLSVVQFFEYAGFKIVFPGDLEKLGWEKLLERSDFRAKLLGTNVLVASHHGRENGICEAVLTACGPSFPQMVVMSDKDKMFDSQETVPWYAGKASGAIVNGTQRYVLTTRSDGNIQIDVSNTGNWSCTTRARA